MYMYADLFGICFAMKEYDFIRNIASDLCGYRIPIIVFFSVCERQPTTNIKFSIKRLK